MKKFVRLFLLCFAMIVIPIQGIATVSMVHCGTGQEHSTSMQKHEHASHQASDTSQQSSTADSVADQGSCCGVGCVGCALMPALITFNLVSSTPEKIDSLFSSHTGHVSDGLERPPRN